MARIESLNILLTTTGKDYLAELYGNVLDNVMATAISPLLKNDAPIGDFGAAGSCEFKRFEITKPKPYGTARAAGKGQSLKVDPVTVSRDTNRELIVEIEQKDIAMYGVDGLMDRKGRQHVLSMTSDLDTAFFSKAVEEGTEFTPTAATLEDQVEEAIVELESTKNDFVDGVPRDIISVVCNPKTYSAIRTYLQKSTRQNRVTGLEDQFDDFNGAACYKSTHLPDGINFVVLVTGSIAQPIYVNQPYKAENIPLSDAKAISMFYYYGTKAVMPDLILYVSGE